jgi:hypothetical protein
MMDDQLRAAAAFAYDAALTAEALAARWEAEGDSAAAAHLRREFKGIVLPLALLAAKGGRQQAQEAVKEAARRAGVPLPSTS